MTITPDEFRRASWEARDLTKAHVERIIQLLSLQPEDHAVHQVEAYRDGMRVPVVLNDNLTVYVYALPWARGWSVFTSPDPSAYAFSWRNVNLKWRQYQVPVYCPRDKTGPYNCSPEQVAASLEYNVRRLMERGKRSRAAIAAQRKAKSNV